MLQRVILALGCLCTLAFAADPEAPIAPHLPPNETALAALQALKPNQAVSLGKAAVVGEFNEVARKFELHKTGPRGRDFTLKMAWAPERQRVLFCGANHAVPHRLNDVWEFDLAAMTWVLLYAPDNARDYTGLGKDPSDVEFKDGLLVTRRGGPAIIGHTWWGLTYDPEQRMLLFMNTWVTDEPKAVKSLGGDPALLYPGPPLWGFSPDTKQWKPIKTDKPYPRPIFGGWLEFIPELHGTMWHANNWQTRSTWLYDAKANAWRDLKSNGDPKAFEKHAAEPEQTGYHDPARKLLIAHRHKATSHYDIAANAWSKVIDEPKDSDKVPHGHDAYAPMVHDPATGLGLLLEYKTRTLWAYNPDKAAWSKLAPEGAPMPTHGKSLAYFDPARKALVVIDGVNVWAYRP